MNAITSFFGRLASLSFFNWVELLVGLILLGLLVARALRNAREMPGELKQVATALQGRTIAYLGGGNPWVVGTHRAARVFIDFPVENLDGVAPLVWLRVKREVPWTLRLRLRADTWDQEAYALGLRDPAVTEALDEVFRGETGDLVIESGFAEMKRLVQWDVKVVNAAELMRFVEASATVCDAILRARAAAPTGERAPAAA